MLQTRVLFFPNSLFLPTIKEEKLAEIKPEGVVLADLQNSLFIPVFSNHQVYLAHQIETINWPVKWLYLNWFFSQDNNTEKKLEFLKKNNIRYIFFCFFDLRHRSRYSVH